MAKQLSDTVTSDIFGDDQNAKPRFIKPRERINPIFLRQIIDENRFKAFCNALENFITELNDGTGQFEAYYQSQIQNFLNAIGYAGKHNVSSIGRTDLAIHQGTSIKTSPIAAIIEVKRPANVEEMCTEDNLNVKALQEALAYSFREILEKNNPELQTLIVTDGWEWFIFSAKDLWSGLTNVANIKRNKYVRIYERFARKELIDNSTAFLYSKVMKPAIDDLIKMQLLECCHFSLKKFVDHKTQKLIVKKSLQDIYRVLAPETLISKETRNDSNILNKGFYNELLYIMGLEEVKKKVDGQEKKIIQRIAAGKRQYHSLLESAMRLASYSFPGTNEEELFEPCLEIVLQWINRIIFLKLLETQLVNFHNGDEKFKFLAAGKFKSFDEIADLFFGVLAVRKEQRNSNLRGDFDLIPYLNSSLFEMTDMERKYVRIGEIKDGKMIPFGKTILLDSKGKSYRTEPIGNLSYLLSFLDSYDFGSIYEKTENATENESSKQLISSSVLGLIFEKINGYKDGSVFTPGVITSYMCKSTLRKVVMQKMRDVFDCDCSHWADLVQWCKEAFRDHILTRQEVSDAIDSIKICDPAVGSGHFLVSALNQLIVIKDELRVLLDSNGKLLNVTIACVNDELEIRDENDEIYQYNYKVERNANIQRTIFNQKQTIIENCLFGVDINPKSVQICQLRLWTELLKSAFYKENVELQTLPNIDINIRSGNSLISHVDVCVGKSIVDSNSASDIKDLVASYKQAVRDYKTLPDTAKKHLVKKEIEGIRQRFASLSYGQTDIDESLNRVYKDGFEWMIEFPEVLSDEGIFQGFDCVLANPPYMRVQSITKFMPDAKLFYDNKFNVANGSYDLANLFVERAMQLSSPNAKNSFIFPHKFLNSSNGSTLRQYFLKDRSVSGIIHFGANQIFQDVITYTCILSFGPQSNDAIEYTYFKYNENYIKTLSSVVKSNKVKYSGIVKASQLYRSDQWILFPTQVDEEIFNKIYEKAHPLGDDVQIFQGIPTSLDDLYILQKQANGSYRVPLSGREYYFEDDFIKPFVRGKDVHRYENLNTQLFIFFPYFVENGGFRPASLDFIRDKCPNTYRYICDHESNFKDRENGKAVKQSHWFGYLRLQNMTKYDLSRISSMEICTNHPNVTMNKAFYHGTKVYSWVIKTESSHISYDYLLGIANSKLLWWFLKLTGDTLSSDSRTMTTNYLNPFPLPSEPDETIKEEIERLVRERLACDETAKETAQTLEDQIDEQICRLYGLEAEQKERILNAF